MWWRQQAQLEQRHHVGIGLRVRIGFGLGVGHGVQRSERQRRRLAAREVNDHGTKAVTDGGELEMELDDFYFGPTFVSGPAGAKVKIDLSNEGQKTTPSPSTRPRSTRRSNPGQKATVDVTLPASGTLAFYCKFHIDAGMQGAFSVS